MAAMTSKFYYVCVIQYYSDQWSCVDILKTSVARCLGYTSIKMTDARGKSINSIDCTYPFFLIFGKNVFTMKFCGTSIFAKPKGMVAL